MLSSKLDLLLVFLVNCFLCNSHQNQHWNSHRLPEKSVQAQPTCCLQSCSSWRCPPDRGQGLKDRCCQGQLCAPVLRSSLRPGSQLSPRQEHQGAWTGGQVADRSREQGHPPTPCSQAGVVSPPGAKMCWHRAEESSYTFQHASVSLSLFLRTPQPHSAPDSAGRRTMSLQLDGSAARPVEKPGVTDWQSRGK